MTSLIESEKVSLLIIVALLMGVNNLSISSISKAESLISTSHGVDLSQVHLDVDVPHDYYDRLYKRVYTHLTRVGLTPKSSTTYKQGEPVLRLTLKVKAVGEPSLNLFLYTAKLEIQERVVTERTPKVRAWVVTWSVGTSDEPEVRAAPITIEEMEKDLDKLMKWFILDYQHAN